MHYWNEPSCVIYKLREKPIEMKETITINEFILKFYLMYDTFMHGTIPALAHRIDQNKRLVANI